MSIKPAFVVFTGSMLLLGAVPIQEKKTPTPDAMEQIVTIAQDILAGRNLQHSLAVLAPGAQLVVGAQVVDLHKVISREDKSISLVEDTSRQATAVRLKTNENDDSAYFLLTTTAPKGVDPRYHTIVFMKNKAGTWLLEHWHTCK